MIGYIKIALLVQISSTALVLDEIINHVQYLQRQVELLSMRLAAVNPIIDFNLDSILAPEVSSVILTFALESLDLVWCMLVELVL
uniref:Uncharacterized protein n=1 Tax=Rhizophora mucronata TaxID=61149 RepID=A0A2P2MRW5_RHIMU